MRYWGTILILILIVGCTQSEELLPIVDQETTPPNDDGMNGVQLEPGDLENQAPQEPQDPNITRTTTNTTISLTGAVYGVQGDVETPDVEVELKYDDGIMDTRLSSNSQYVISFSAPQDPFEIRKVKIYGIRYGTSPTDLSFKIGILDKDFKILTQVVKWHKEFSKDSFSWIEIDIPIVVNDEFYVLLETYSKREYGISVGIDTSVNNIHSEIGRRGTLIEWDISNKKDETNWMIRVMGGNKISTSTDIDDTDKFLQYGGQTETSEQIIEAVEYIEKRYSDPIEGTFSWMKLNIDQNSNYPGKMEIFRKRTADQIITDGFATGCTDNALVFITLMREQNIPASYLETASEDWVESGELNSITGHVFSRVYINNEWVWVDPTKYEFGDQADILEGYVHYDEGLDSWDIGISSFDDMQDLWAEKYNKTN